MLKRILALLAFALVATPAVADPRSFNDPNPNFYAAARMAFTPPFASARDAAVLAADTLVLMAIPTGARIINLSCDGNVWVKIGVVSTTLTIPTATSTDQQAPTLNPAARYIPEKLVDGTTPTHLILRAPAAAKCSVEWYGG